MPCCPVAAVAPLLITGGCGWTTIDSACVPVPETLPAATVTLKVPVTLGVPAITAPVSVMPAGRLPITPKLVGELLAVIV